MRRKGRMGGSKILRKPEMEREKGRQGGGTLKRAENRKLTFWNVAGLFNKDKEF